MAVYTRDGELIEIVKFAKMLSYCYHRELIDNFDFLIAQEELHDHVNLALRSRGDHGLLICTTALLKDKYGKGFVGLDFVLGFTDGRTVNSGPTGWYIKHGCGGDHVIS